MIDPDRPHRPSVGMERQMEIYTGGPAGVRPGRPFVYETLLRDAERVLTPEAFGYLAGGAGSGETMRANREVFRRWRIVPRMLRDVSSRDLSVELLGHELRAPILLAPIGVQGIFHEGGEVATARAAASAGLPIVLSTVSSKSMEDVARAMGDAPRWYQLYWPADPEFAGSLLARAEAAGYSAIVVTLDTHHLAWRPRDLANAYLPFVHGDGLANYLTDPVFRADLEAPPEEDPGPAIRKFARLFSNPALTWDDLAFLRDRSDLPIVLKGILHPDDARLAVDHGVDGVVVSNHGGRQVDGSIGALDALPGVVDAVDGRVPVLFDSGIRTAADVFRAVALGARAVLLGRPYACALAVGGEDAVRELLIDLLAELDLTLALSGHARMAEVDRDALVAR